MANSSAEKAVGLTEYMFKLPGTGMLLAFASILSLLVSVTSSFVGLWVKHSQISIENILINLGLSFALALVFSFIVSRLSRKMKFKQLLAAYLASELILSIFMLLSYFGIEFIAIGMGLLFAMWYLVARLVFAQVYRAPVVAVLYLLFQLPLAIFFSADAPLFIMNSVIASIIFLVGLYVVFWLIDAPVKRIFGVTGVSLVTMFFAQWLRGTKELEDIFAKFAEKVKTNIDVICFRGKRSKDKITFIVPHLHFGPFGNLGGSEFPHLIARGIGMSKYDHTFVFHGTATHDFNPIKSEDVVKLTHAAKEAVEGMKFESIARIIHGRGDECSVSGIASRNAGFCMLTHAPKVTEDIDFSVGLALKNHAEKFIGKAAIIDAHNAETGELIHVESGSPLVFDYQKAIENAFQGMQKARYDSLELGISSFYPRLHSIGHAGIKIALFRTGKKKFCMVVIDANGITPGFRNRILAALRDKDIDGEVCTTDTHSVNVVKGVINPIGQGMSDYETELLIHDIVNCVKKAEHNLSKVEFGVGSSTVEIDVFGPKRATELVGAANSIAAVLKWAAPTILLICGIASYIFVRAV